MNRRRQLFIANRVLLILAVAAALGGLMLGHWEIVQIKAIIL
jgi:hypothetical protein